jgi:hypothetical protein
MVFAHYPAHLTAVEYYGNTLANVPRRQWFPLEGNFLRFAAFRHRQVCAIRSASRKGRIPDLITEF